MTEGLRRFAGPALKAALLGSEAAVVMVVSRMAWSRRFSSESSLPRPAVDGTGAINEMRMAQLVREVEKGNISKPDLSDFLAGKLTAELERKIQECFSKYQKQ